MNKFFAVVISVIFLGCSQSALYAQVQQADKQTNLKTETSDIVVNDSSEEITDKSSTSKDSEGQSVLPYDFSSTESVPITLSITKEISTKDEIIEGQKLEFRVLKDVYYKNQLIVKKNDLITATLETIVTSGMNGFPAEIIVGNFEIPGVKSSQLQGVYIKKGQNRCFWVYPLKWALTFIPFVGSLTNFIMGGHARLKTSDIVTLYYFPQWR